MYLLDLELSFAYECTYVGRFHIDRGKGRDIRFTSSMLVEY